jgi:hypothetical protein
MLIGDIPAVYRRFSDVIGSRSWTHRVAQARATIRSNRFLEAYLHAENEIAFGLDRCGDLLKRYGGLPDDASTNRAMYPAITFAAQTLSLIDLGTSIARERMRKRVAGSFQNPSDMRALRLELTTAAHFARRGHRLQWPEMVGGGTFDLLVADMGNGGVEVECKSISNDKGRNIHRREALEFHHLLSCELVHIRRTLKIGLSVVLTVPGRLPTPHADRQTLAKRVSQQIVRGSSALFDDGTDIRITEFDLARLGDVVDERRGASLRAAIKDVTDTQNREAMLICTQAGGALAFVVRSALDDDLINATFKALSDAAKRQLSATRPGLLIAGFEGLTSEQLWSIAQQDRDADQMPTALSIRVSRFLSSHHRNHVVGVGFLSSSALRPIARDLVDSGGTAYYFPKRQSPFWHDDLGGLFDWSDAADADLPEPSVAD